MTIDELTLFQALRPDNETLPDAARDSLRRHLFGIEPSAAHPTHQDHVRGEHPVVVDLARPSRHDARPTNPRHRWASYAAAALIVAAPVALAGLAQLRDDAPNQGDRPTAPSSTPGGTTPTTPDAAAAGTSVVASEAGVTVESSEPPKLTFEGADWTMTRFDDTTWSVPAAVFVDPVAGFAGPWASITLLYDGVSTYQNDRTVDINGVSGTLSTAGEASLLTWPATPDQTFSASSWALDADHLLDIARSISLDATGNVTTTGSVAGLAVADEHTRQLLGRQIEYGFTNQDGRMVEARLLPGGRAMFFQRGADDDTDTPTSVNGFEASLQGEVLDPASRVDILTGFWVLEIDGHGFSSTDEFLAAAADLRPSADPTNVDIPAGYLHGADLTDAAAEIIADIPVPAGVDLAPPALAEATMSRYQLVTRITGAAACGWLDAWFDANDRSDSTRAAEAATALKSSHQWSGLQEMAQQGGWSSVVWEIADAVNGGPGVATGAGPQRPTRANTYPALGCR